MPATLAILVQVFPEEERPKAFAAWAAVAAVAMAGGPALGGFLVAEWSWAAVFWINVPLAAGALAVVAWLVPESSDPAAARVDVGSAVLVTVGMSGVVLAVVVAGEAGAARPAAVVGAVVAAAALAWFAIRQRRATAPLADFALYRDRRFSGAGVAAALLTLGTGSALFVLTQYLQLVLGFTALQAGAALTPLAVGVVVGSSASSRASTAATCPPPADPAVPWPPHSRTPRRRGTRPSPRRHAAPSPRPNR